jgi:hypothetical protein
MNSGEFGRWGTEIPYNAMDGTDDERDENNAALLDLSIYCGEREWVWRGLMARSVGEGKTFTRVGTFEYRMGMLGEGHQDSRRAG